MEAEYPGVGGAGGDPGSSDGLTRNKWKGSGGTPSPCCISPGGAMQLPLHFHPEMERPGRSGLVSCGVDGDGVCAGCHLLVTLLSPAASMSSLCASAAGRSTQAGLRCHFIGVH